jgi:hypothetical protein
VAAAVVAVAAVAGCAGHGGEAAPTIETALSAVPLRRTGEQVVDVQLARRQPAGAVCDRLTGATVRIRDAGLTITVPDGPAPALPPGIERIVPFTKASYVTTAGGQAASWLDRTLAVGPEDDVAAFVGVDLDRTSSVAAARAVTRVVRVLDEADVYAAVLHSPAGPPDPAEGDAVWTARAMTPDGRLLTVTAGAEGPVETTASPAPDPCAYRRGT